jgi:hypothetical protein
MLFPAAEIVFPVNLRFLLRGETVKNLKNLFNGYSEGDAPVNGYLVRYILADDVAVRRASSQRRTATYLYPGFPLRLHRANLQREL